MTHRYTHENDQEIADLYLAGRTTRELAALFGVSTGPISQALKRKGVQPRVGCPPSGWRGSEEQKVGVVAAYQGGESVRKIAARLKCRATVIIETLNEAGVARRHPGSHEMFDDITVSQIVEGYAGGAPLTELARQHGTNHITIRNYLVRRGVELRQPGASLFWTDERKAEAARRYEAGESQQQIADAFGCNQTSVSNALRELGVLTRIPMRGENHHSWHGGRHIDSAGYVRVYLEDADAHLLKPHFNGRVMEHRLVMARKLGRPLTKHETVHHIDGNRQNNAPGNLQLRQGQHGKGMRSVCLDCGSHNIGHDKIG